MHLSTQRVFLSIAISLLAFAKWAEAKCESKTVPDSIRPAFQAFQQAENLSLADPLPDHFTNREEEFILRVRTKQWVGFGWDLKPHEISEVTSAQEKYWVKCNAFADSVIDDLLLDLRSGKVPLADQPKATLMLLMNNTCAEGNAKESVDSFMAKQFVENTSDFFDLLLSRRSREGQLFGRIQSLRG